MNFWSPSPRGATKKIGFKCAFLLTQTVIQRDITYSRNAYFLLLIQHCFILWLKLIFCLYIEPIRKTYPNPKFVFLSVALNFHSLNKDICSTINKESSHLFSDSFLRVYALKLVKKYKGMKKARSWQKLSERLRKKYPRKISMKMLCFNFLSHTLPNNMLIFGFHRPSSRIGIALYN